MVQDQTASGRALGPEKYLREFALGWHCQHILSQRLTPFCEAGDQVDDFKENKIFFVYLFAQESETVQWADKWPYDKSFNFVTVLSNFFPYHS